MGRTFFSNSFGTWTLKALPWGIQLTAVANSGRERMECTCAMRKCERLVSPVRLVPKHTWRQCIMEYKGGAYLFREGHVINTRLGFPSRRRRNFTKVAIGVVHDPRRHYTKRIWNIEQELERAGERWEMQVCDLREGTSCIGVLFTTQSPFLTSSLFHKVFQTKTIKRRNTEFRSCHETNVTSAGFALLTLYPLNQRRPRRGKVRISKHSTCPASRRNRGLLLVIAFVVAFTTSRHGQKKRILLLCWRECICKSLRIGALLC